MTAPSPSFVTVQHLAQAQLRTVYPLMREAAPALSLPGWLQYARPVAAAAHPGRAGILVAHRRGATHPVGAVCYRRDRDMRFGVMLTAEHFIAVDLLYPEAVIHALLGALDRVAGTLRCTAIRSIVHGPRAGLIDDLCLSGHVAEGVTFTKKIMASAAPRYMHSEP